MAVDIVASRTTISTALINQDYSGMPGNTREYAEGLAPIKNADKCLAVDIGTAPCGDYNTTALIRLSCTPFLPGQYAVRPLENNSAP